MIAAAVAEWKNKNTPEKFAKDVETLLTKRSEEIVLKLLGFDNHWGRWEVDHCNGRGGESAMGDYLRSTQKAAIEQWLRNVELPAIPAQATKKMKSDYLYEYKEQMAKHLQQAAHKRAEEDAQKIVDQLTTTDHIQNYIKAMNLISQA